MTLTTATVRSNRLKPGRYLDGDGLYLVVAKGGSKSWTLRTTVNGKQHEFGLGSARKVSLRAARAGARAKREQIDHGVDLTAPVPTLATAARIVHTLHAPNWSSPKYNHQWLADLRNHCPDIMNVQVDRLSSAHVLSVLDPLWNTNPKLARSLRQRLSLIGAWIVAQGYLQTNPAGEVLDGVLPKRKSPTEHFASTPTDEAPAALAALEALDTPAALAIRFAILTATRSNETRGARWTEIDVDDALWTVPTERTKMRRPHRVPLSTAALAVLEEARTLPASDDLVFPSRRGQVIHHSDQRQLLLPVDADYCCRSWGETIWYRRYRIGHRSAGSATEAEANGRQEPTSGGGGIWYERADGADVAARQAAVGEEGQETVANSTGPVRRGMGRGGRAPSAERR